ncbi:MAG: hypothetical protein GKR87_13845 [Kiritimatiellae bacterium]|nr:hypothetical protein [Kiritimatiellia bacterium]
MSVPLSYGQFTNFNSGSDGSDGALNVTVTTNVDLPPDGIFHYTTITISNGATLKFNRNALNTPVYLLAQGDITILGDINVSGKNSTVAGIGEGGPGGFDGGAPGFGPLLPGAGQGAWGWPRR